MPVLNRAAEMQEEVAGWRRHLHEHPEILYDVHETAKFVADKLTSFGCDVVETGIGRTGVVAIIKGRQGDGPTVGFRADMDALPILETSGKEWASKTPGKAHSCGHDGHTAMLLGAAQYLAETRNFKGSVAVIFQPAEEGGAGALAMIEDGFIEKHSISQVYGMHNSPGLPLGEFAIRKGSVMAAADTFEIIVNGRGSHAAQPHLSVDPVLTAGHIVVALQSIVSRQTDPLKSLVVTVKVAGPKAVDMTMAPHMGAEDFSYMLERRPGAFIFIGNGDTASLHNPAYDFNDEALPYGISYWVTLAETALAA